ncbi:hypothetical protein AB0L39_32060, partial [Streptomyces parvus]
MTENNESHVFDPVVPDSPETAVPEKPEAQAGGCPVAHGRAPHPTQGGGNRQWWPDRLNLKILAKNPAVANPLGEEFDYAAAFEALDLPAVKRDIADQAVPLDQAVQGGLAGERVGAFVAGAVLKH